ncbi:methyl coenzyme M reductase subunit gamma [uncultured Rothia sp.]|uniref:methyl coenzyme M reductase subunit gamma n=1 Tax=uncultured Rothia sp. TaxID=316088 RepID=UPI0028EDDFF4|nr:methyl coenzyme M reductase subunit gamma [uncultured Rothia sp.]
MMFSRTTRTSVAALSAAMLLTLSACSGGTQVNAESSTSTSASAESASAEASATPTPSPTPTGYEPVLIRASIDVDNRSQEAADATLKAAYDALEQHRRIWNAWMQGSLEHTSDEELLRYVSKEFLEDTKEDVENVRKFIEEGRGPVKGEVTFNNIDPVTYGTMHDDGSTTENTGATITFCEDWSNIRSAEGKKFRPAQLTRRVFVVRRSEDNAFVVVKSETLHDGCGDEAAATNEASAAQSE